MVFSPPRGTVGPSLSRGERAAIAGEMVEGASPRLIYRQGTFSNEAMGWEGNFVKGRQWATENPLTTPNYAEVYGLPSENTGTPDWVVGAKVEDDYTTRPAPASHNNPANVGNAIEVLPQNPDTVVLDWFYMPDKPKRPYGTERTD